MSQEIRRQLAARERANPDARKEADFPPSLQIRRFSEGLEGAVLDRVRRLRVGRFSTGEERLPLDDLSKTRIGRFSRGQDHGPDDAPEHLRLGSYADRDRSEAG